MERGNPVSHAQVTREPCQEGHTHNVTSTQIGRPPLVLSGQKGSGLWGRTRASVAVSGCCTVLSSHSDEELGAPGSCSAKFSSLCCLLVEPNLLSISTMGRRSRRTMTRRGRRAAAESTKGWDCVHGQKTPAANEDPLSSLSISPTVSFTLCAVPISLLVSVTVPPNAVPVLSPTPISCRLLQAVIWFLPHNSICPASQLS